MEQDVDNAYSKMCNTCLSSDRDLILLDDQSELYKIFRVMMYDFAGDGFVDSMADQKLYACWECVAMIRRFSRFKRRVHTAQEHLRVLCLTGGTQEPLDHTYLARTLSTLEVADRSAFDKIYFDYTTKTQTDWSPHYIAISTSDNIKNERYDIAHIVKENINLELDENVLSGMVLENPTTVVSPHIVINAEPLVSQTYKEGEEYVVPDLTIRTVSENSMNLILEPATSTAESDDEKPDKTSYITQYINEEDMMSLREDTKQKILYASSIFKCELCVLGFYNQQQVEEHYVNVHKAGLRISPNGESNRVMNMQRRTTAGLIRIGDAAAPQTTKRRRKREKEEPVDQEQDMKKLLSKTTIVGYKCLECDMFFKNYRARNNHVARYHREGLQCDHCKKRFVNKTTLATHLRLHEGPPPRAACPVCGKQVRVVQLKYHVQRHQSRARYECAQCAKSFSHLATYQAHLKYSRAHATDQVFKFPCPMCNKGYPTKEAMQDHFNYQHLGKTSHKCPVCNKPIASKANVEKHMMRIHGDKKERPRNHVCQQCGKAFTDKKALKQHEVIHSGDRPLSCEICQQTFKQKASLYTHKKRVHNVVPPKRVVEFMETKSVEA